MEQTGPAEPSAPPLDDEFQAKIDALNRRLDHLQHRAPARAGPSRGF
ncbi:MAG: hypothetical protein M5U14_16590 [Acidimicrobiia bacterium]|nr:hypothetical protein [Acidimicrobiia bacterium]